MSESKKSGSGRRGFLKTVALGAGIGPQMAAAQAQPPAAPAAPAAPTAPAAPVAPAAPPARAPITYPRVFRGRQLATLAFPLGGVGAGSVSLGGRGQLRDWEIFNRPEKGRNLPYTFAAIWAQSGSAKPVARVLESRLQAPFQTGGGLSPGQVSGLTRLDDARFTGEFPMARIDFRDRSLPVKVSLDAFTPFIPHDPDDSGLPVAILRYRVSNPGKSAAQVSIAFSLENPVGSDPRARSSNAPPSKRTNEFRSGAAMDGLLMTDPASPEKAPMTGSIALCVLRSGQDEVTHLTGWPKAKWWASPLLFWDDFTSDGKLGPEAEQRNPVGSLCQSRTIAPGKEETFTFVLAWNFPNRTPAWCGWEAPKGEENAVIGNYYATRFPNAWRVAEYTAEHLEVLEKRTRAFMQVMRESTLPAAVKDAAMANLSTLVSNTCFRTADGKFRGFEGCGDNSGCCHGNCTHVWNYEVATQHLFPSLARSMREAMFELGDRLDGSVPIRLALPEGKQTGGTSAADGTWGQIIKAYLDWRLYGDEAWLRRMWPKIRKAMEFAWVEGGWDANRDGVAEGVQHNTYDVEFYGPNPLCGVYYLGALHACEKLARAAGDGEFGEKCGALAKQGAQWMDANLFNGEFYVQHIQGIPSSQIHKSLRAGMGAEDTEHPDFQVGEGCLTDQLIGQYLADLAGLGPLLDPAHIRKTIDSIYKYNHRANLERHDSVERIYALNDEAAVLVCDYAPGKRPRIPFPYASEAWTGIEYLFGSQLIFAGKEREGVQVFTDVRSRYDGERRNPWDEPECGHHYARALSSWSGILALSGFRYDAAAKAVEAAPRLRAERTRSFWATGTGWGTFTHSTQGGRASFSLNVVAGKLQCGSVEVASPATAGASSAALGSDALAHEVYRSHNRARIQFREPVELKEGQTLTLSA